VFAKGLYRGRYSVLQPVMGPFERNRIGAVQVTVMAGTKKNGYAGHSGFSLIELLVVIAIIVILAALLLPVLSRSKEQAQGVSCKNHLHEMGISLALYVSEHNIYPPGLGLGTPFKTWPDLLATYNPIPWTNAVWQCPSYLAEGGSMERELSRLSGGGTAWKAYGSYAYNAQGMTGFKKSGRILVLGNALGLGMLNLNVPDNRIVAPSEMYATGDTRPTRGTNGCYGHILMWPWKLLETNEVAAPHAGGYNLLFVDGHVSLIKRNDYLYPPKTAQNWNRDHQPHPELWPATNEWAVQN
jgi:prepilin-type N-terminal cleavage/methylation domain-containing protein/prepilin-type processing-associated H-X9-DG protein